MAFYIGPTPHIALEVNGIDLLNGPKFGVGFDALTFFNDENRYNGVYGKKHVVLYNLRALYIKHTSITRSLTQSATKSAGRSANAQTCVTLNHCRLCTVEIVGEEHEFSWNGQH